jgi:hypothetical protein
MIGWLCTKFRVNKWRLGAKDNQKLFELLAQFKVSDFDGIASVLQDFHDVIDTAAQKRSKTLKNKLAKTYFISGSAVVPNLEIDEAWRKNFGEIRVIVHMRIIFVKKWLDPIPIPRLQIS